MLMLYYFGDNYAVIYIIEGIHISPNNYFEP